MHVTVVLMCFLILVSAGLSATILSFFMTAIPRSRKLRLLYSPVEHINTVIMLFSPCMNFSLCKSTLTLSKTGRTAHLTSLLFVSVKNGAVSSEAEELCESSLIAESFY